MGSSEVDKSSKEEKATKEPKTPASQAYMPPHGFMASSRQAHPYMWGVQQYIPSYGTPPHPCVPMYPHGGIYAHPTMAFGSYPFSPFAMPSPNGIAESSGIISGNAEVDGKSSEGKKKLPVKRYKGSLGSLDMVGGKNNDPSKTSGTSANGVNSKSAESASDASTDAHSQDESPAKSSSRPDSAEPSQNGSSRNNHQNGGLNPPHSMVNETMGIVAIPTAGAVCGVPSPTTNLNIGMNYWGDASSSAISAVQGKVSAAPVSGEFVSNGSQEIIQSHLFIKDERELKRQKRKQSNRESALRSRLRKQAECDELAQHAETLKEENASLREKVSRIRSEYEELLAQNVNLRERLGAELPD